MSYKCNECSVVCHHSQIKVVTDIRQRQRGWEIGGEAVLCESCAIDAKINVPVRALSQGPKEDDSVVSTLVGSC